MRQFSQDEIEMHDESADESLDIKHDESADESLDEIEETRAKEMIYFI